MDNATASSEIMNWKWMGCQSAGSRPNVQSLNYILNNLLDSSYCNFFNYLIILINTFNTCCTNSSTDLSLLMLGDIK